MIMWRKVGWEWGKDCHVVSSTFVHSSESEITNCELLWQFNLYSIYPLWYLSTLWLMQEKVCSFGHLSFMPFSTYDSHLNFHLMTGYTVAINTCIQTIYTKLHGYDRLTSWEVSFQLDKWGKMYLLTPMKKSIAFLGHMSSVDCSVKLAKKCSRTFILEHDSYSITWLITCLWIWFW